MAMKCSFDATHGLVMRFFHITGSPFRVRHQLLYAERRIMLVLVSGIVVTRNKRLDINNAGNPCFCNPLHLLNKTAACDLRGSDLLFGGKW